MKTSAMQEQSLYSEYQQKTHMLHHQTSQQSNSPVKITIQRMDEVGKIWSKNEKQKRSNKSLKRKGVRQLGNFQKKLNQLSRVVDDTMMQIRKNV